MKFIQADNGQFTFQMTRREKQMLFQLLRLYPAIPAGHHEWSRAEDRPEDEQLLEEALAAHRAENKKLVLALMAGKTEFHANNHGYRFCLSAGQVEWLLQVLNDIRVGSWLALGSPDGPADVYAALNEKSVPHFWAMEAVGGFQMALLHALNGGQ